ncbi:hypothetical protein K458DRAFT_410973 [Lentithecium fluviatile CBS 122367]|uniref:Uncharacterized protein n=1 Tax=Lentithecium fluviatile CBS 122367 TaxID=1168545 RepID=A0A6G1IC38_9PLEO|nr:hypothetical protein K458DRAFT_410973 [Lentithecium fluviatile CBS 122367]
MLALPLGGLTRCKQPAQVYSGTFSLKEVDYDVVAEIDDGIFEPGEYINIQNIVRKEGCTGSFGRSRLRLATPANRCRDRYDETFIDLIRPGEVVEIEEQIIVSEHCLESSTTVLRLKLFLESLKESATSRHCPPQAFLAKAYPLQITGRRCFNISITGSMGDPSTGNSVLNSYERKSVILFANTFKNFRYRQRSIFDLLDPWEVTRLAKLGTSFVFLGTKDEDAMREWGRDLLFPASCTSLMSPVDAANLDGLIAELSPGRRDALGARAKTLVPPILIRPIQIRFWTGAGAVSVGAIYPLHRFLISSYLGLGVRGNEGTVTVFEGLPLTANILCSPPDLEDTSDGGLWGHHACLLLSALSLQVQVSMFWNFAGYWDMASLPYGAIHDPNPIYLTAGHQDSSPDQRAERLTRLQGHRIPPPLPLHRHYLPDLRLLRRIAHHRNPHIQHPIALTPSLRTSSRRAPTSLPSSPGFQKHPKGLFTFILASLLPAMCAERLASSRTVYRPLKEKLAVLYSTEDGTVSMRLRNMKVGSEKIKRRIQEANEPGKEIWFVLEESWLELTVSPWSRVVDLARGGEKDSRSDRDGVETSRAFSEIKLRGLRVGWRATLPTIRYR